MGCSPVCPWSWLCVVMEETSVPKSIPRDSRDSETLRHEDAVPRVRASGCEGGDEFSKFPCDGSFSMPRSFFSVIQPVFPVPGITPNLAQCPDTTKIHGRTQRQLLSHCPEQKHCHRSPAAKCHFRKYHAPRRRRMELFSIMDMSTLGISCDFPHVSPRQNPNYI